MRRLLALSSPSPLCLLLALAMLLSTAACGGGAGSVDEPFEQGLPTLPGGDFTPPLPTPPPEPSTDPIWNPTAANLGRTALFGSFSSDLVRHGSTLFTVDSDAVELQGANILAFDVSSGAPAASTQFATTTILDAHLVDSQGNAGDAKAPVGFGYFLNDIEIVSNTLGFVLVNAGGSDSIPTLSNLVVFNPTTGAIRQTLQLHLPYTSASALADSNAVPVPGNEFIQSGAEAMAWFPTSPTQGRLYIAMSNLVFGAPSYGATKYPGTVQVIDIDTGRGTPASHIVDVPPYTRTIQTQMYNPVSLARITAVAGPQDPPVERLLVTCAGTTGYDSDFNLVPVRDAAVEAYNTANDAFEGLFNLGKAGLASVRPALGKDGSGNQVGFFPSSVTGEIYLIQLDGLYSASVDPGRLAVLRGELNGIPITASQAGSPGGNITGLGLSPDGRSLAVCGFGDLFASPVAPGRLFLLNLPADLISGAGFGSNFVPGATEFASTAGQTLGNLVLVPGDGSAPEIYVSVSGSLDENFLGSGNAYLGSLQTFGLFR